MNFKNKTYNEEKLIKFGFKPSGNKLVYSTSISEGQFKLTVTVDKSGEVETELFDSEAEEVYTLHLVTEACGEFVGKVRTEYEKVLESIAEKCFDSGIFGGQCTKKVLDYALKKYGDEPEFLWEKYPDAAVLRRKDNRKWYALFMTVSKAKLGLDDDEPAEIIDLRFDVEKLPEAVDGERYFPGYHMNKKHWITMLLDGSVPLEELLGHLDNSYRSAK